MCGGGGAGGGGADSNVDVPRRGSSCRRQLPTRGDNFMIFGGRHNGMTPKHVGIQSFLVTQMNISN